MPPFQPELRAVLFPTLLSSCHGNSENTAILAQVAATQSTQHSILNTHHLFFPLVQSACTPSVPGNVLAADRRLRKERGGREGPAGAARHWRLLGREEGPAGAAGHWRLLGPGWGLLWLASIADSHTNSSFSGVEWLLALFWCQFHMLTRLLVSVSHASSSTGVSFKERRIEVQQQHIPLSLSLHAM